MRVNRKKLSVAMARACIDSKDLPELTGMPRPTVNNVITGRSVRPATLGRIAKALNCDPVDLIDSDD